MERYHYCSIFCFYLYARVIRDVYEVGQITDFMDIPNNPCIEVETENGAVILPLHEDFILGIDPENQEIVMKIPEGLLN